jgi:hypothetical protein
VAVDCKQCLIADASVVDPCPEDDQGRGAFWNATHIIVVALSCVFLLVVVVLLCGGWLLLSLLLVVWLCLPPLLLSLSLVVWLYLPPLLLSLLLVVWLCSCSSSCCDSRMTAANCPRSVL